MDRIRKSPRHRSQGAPEYGRAKTANRIRWNMLKMREDQREDQRSFPGR